MTFELPQLTVNMARAIILDIAEDAQGYNKSWSWWAYDAQEGVSYTIGHLQVTLVKNEHISDGYDSYDDSSKLLLVWQVEGPWEDKKFFTMSGSAPSYGGNEWDGDFREAKATTKTVIVYE